MRLIDAYKLEEKIEDVSRGYISVYGVEEDDIYNAETVEAIPVDWIINFKNSTKAGALMEPREVVNFMLEVWKEEQKGS